MKKMNLLLLGLCLLSSCESDTIVKTIHEGDIIKRISLAESTAKKKYWVVTYNYNFLTNEVYKVGDTLYIKK